MKVKKAIARFLERCEERVKADQLAPKTVKYYAAGLRVWGEMWGDVRVKDLESQHYSDWLIEARVQFGKEARPDTMRRNIGTVKAWQDFLIEIGELKKKFQTDFSKPAGVEREYLPTDDDIAAIRPHLRADFRLAWEALRQCGARPGELSRMEYKHWDRVNGEIVLQKHKTERKTGKPRRIAVGAVLEQMILQSLNGRTEGYLFLDENGLPWDTNKLGGQFRAARNKAGLSKEWVNYITRHEHGTAVYESQGELAAARSLGHTSTAMTARYARIRKHKLKQNQDGIQLAGSSAKQESV